MVLSGSSWEKVLHVHHISANLVSKESTVFLGSFQGCLLMNREKQLLPEQGAALLTALVLSRDNVSNV